MPKNRAIAAGILSACLTFSCFPTASSQPLASSFSEPVPNITVPEWSGLDVRESGALGTLPSSAGVALREVPMDESLHLESAAVNQRFAYTTINQHNEIALSTAALYMPGGEAPDGGWPVLAWAHGTVGIGDDCTPSAGHRNDSALVNDWVARGYAVIASDYTGLGTPGLMPYNNGRATAPSVADAVVAAHDLQSAEGALSTKWAAVGQSQGAGAALHVAHAAGSQESTGDLDFRGAVATGTPGYIETIVSEMGPAFPPVPLPGSLNAYLIYILAGFRESHPEFDIDSVLTEEGRQVLAASETSCLREFRQAGDWAKVSDLFTSPVKSIPGVADAINDYLATPTDGYNYPIFLGHGLLDTDVPSPIGAAVTTEAWINQLEGSNSDVEVHWYPTNHNDTPLAAADDAAVFLDRIFAG